MKPRCSATEPAVESCESVLEGEYGAKDWLLNSIKCSDHGDTHTEETLTQSCLCVHQEKSLEAAVAMRRPGKGVDACPMAVLREARGISRDRADSALQRLQ